LFNRKVSIHLARVDVSAGNSLSTPQYYDRTFVITVLLIMFSPFPFTEINVCTYVCTRPWTTDQTRIKKSRVACYHCTNRVL